MSKDLAAKYRTSALSGANAAFVESFYESYLTNPSSVNEHWRTYFNDLRSNGGAHDIAHRPIQESLARRAEIKARNSSMPGEVLEPAQAERQASVLRLINAHRTRGHQCAQIDPLNLYNQPLLPDLDPIFYGLSEADMDTVFHTGSLFAPKQLSLREILMRVRKIYLGTLGTQYMHIVDTSEKRWIQQRLEGSYNETLFLDDEQNRILANLTAAEGIEHYLHTRYVGQKRFSLEGGDSLIPQLDALIRAAANSSMDEIVIGMAHRGRLNVLVNILGKSPKELFEEFEGQHSSKSSENHSGDVKYHLGFSSDIEVDGHRVHLALGFNPSHLEIVDPVILGSVRARQDRRNDHEGVKVLPLLIHGDAAFSGQGVVMETLNMSQTDGFYVGGTVHIVINNQLGFTTDPKNARSTPYCTDVAKMLEIPVFHVNGDDPEAVIYATRLAFEYRMAFHKDVVIDLVCYRRHGHNEADEPAVTQPLMYHTIKQHPTSRTIYGRKLVEIKVIRTDDLDQLWNAYRDGLDEGRNISRTVLMDWKRQYMIEWDDYSHANWSSEIDTTLSKNELTELAYKASAIPEGIEMHSRVKRIISDRHKMAAGALPADWGFAETLAYASLLTAGTAIRLSGQDVGRGTFFHRHATVSNQLNGESYAPLAHLSDHQARFDIIDSLLSEAGVLGFEYGYATAAPDTLVIWEAQFGDFANGAQVVIDQFISSGETKWKRFCGLTLLLPHGYEGQGPEHSSARLERYLQLCAQKNMQVCVPSTPAQMFHMLRRQMLRHFRKPLVVMTPKSLLRRRLAMSNFEDFYEGGFKLLIDEIDQFDPEKIQRIVFCSGKVYYDLLESRRERNIEDIAIVRIEQLYPFPFEEYQRILQRYPVANDIIWCQEEPMNQGAWFQIRHHLQNGLEPRHQLHYIGRHGSASTAVGYYDIHIQQQKGIVQAALTLNQAESNPFIQ